MNINLNPYQVRVIMKSLEMFIESGNKRLKTFDNLRDSTLIRQLHREVEMTMLEAVSTKKHIQNNIDK